MTESTKYFIAYMVSFLIAFVSFFILATETIAKWLGTTSRLFLGQEPNGTIVLICGIVFLVTAFFASFFNECVKDIEKDELDKFRESLRNRNF